MASSPDKPPHEAPIADMTSHRIDGIRNDLSLVSPSQSGSGYNRYEAVWHPEPYTGWVLGAAPDGPAFGWVSIPVDRSAMAVTADEFWRLTPLRGSGGAEALAALDRSGAAAAQWRGWWKLSSRGLVGTSELRMRRGLSASETWTLSDDRGTLARIRRTRVKPASVRARMSSAAGPALDSVSVSFDWTRIQPPSPLVALVITYALIMRKLRQPVIVDIA